MGFEGLDGPLDAVAAVHIQGDQLELGLPGDSDGLFVGCTGLVVQDLELGGETP